MAVVGAAAVAAVPGHGDASLRPGHDHLMLEDLIATLRVGQTVTASLRFDHAGSVVMRAPVVPFKAGMGS